LNQYEKAVLRCIDELTAQHTNDWFSLNKNRGIKILRMLRFMFVMFDFALFSVSHTPDNYF